MNSTNRYNNDLCKLNASEAVNAFKAGEISPVDITQAALERAETINGTLNAFVMLDHDNALKAAKASEDRWRSGQPLSPIDGLPTTIKDIVRCKGWNVRYGSKVTPDVSMLPDSPTVERLRAAGAILMGLTTTPEFGWKAVTDNPTDGITRNPWQPSQTPGGSSGGAAVAAATGAGVLHLGTDGGGSIRIPAAFCGVVGHKPSFGRVPAHPPSVFGTVAHIGPMARSVNDVMLMLNAMSGKDLLDWAQGPLGFQSVAPSPIDYKNCRIGLWSQPCVGGVADEVNGALQSAVADFEAAGAVVEPVELPMQSQLLDIFYRHWYVGAANRLATVDESEYGKLDPGLVRTAAKGRQYSAVERAQAEVERAQFGAAMDALLEQYDYLISPTVPITAFEAGRDIPKDTDMESWVEWCSFSFPINLSQQPACTVPCGKSKAGLPMGLQIIGARGADEKVLSAAMAYELMHPEYFIGEASTWPSIENIKSVTDTQKRQSQ